MASKDGREASSACRGTKESYLEFLRAAATIAVVFLHINTAVGGKATIGANLVAGADPAAGTDLVVGVAPVADPLGIVTCMVSSDCRILVKWAVPCFLMISGALLLNPAREMTYDKIKRYIRRMVLVLLTFGTVYALLELIFSEKSISVLLVGRAFLNMLQGKSWTHMWYVYMLIGLYLLTMPMRYITQKATVPEIEKMVLVLGVGVFLIPSVNTVFSLKLESYMLFSEYIAWYFTGYYLSVTKRKLLGVAIPTAVGSVLAMICLENYALYATGKSFALNNQAKNIFIFLLGCSVFVIVKETVRKKEYAEGKLCEIICRNSFAIYLIHPFFINLIYKVFRITPVSFPLGAGIPLLFLVVFVLSLTAAVIMRKMPFFRTFL